MGLAPEEENRKRRGDKLIPRDVCSPPRGDFTEPNCVAEVDQSGPMLEALVYIVFCLLTGLCGIDRRMGFFGTFVLALVVTPLVVLPVLLITGPSRRAALRRQP